MTESKGTKGGKEEGGGKRTDSGSACKLSKMKRKRMARKTMGGKQGEEWAAA